MPPPGLRRAALLALVAAAVLQPWHGLVPAEAQAVTPRTDLAVLEVLPGAPVAGQAGVVAAVVQNLGPDPARALSVTFGWNTSAAPLAPGSSVEWPRDRGNFTDDQPPGCRSDVGGLASGCRVRVTLAWEPPADGSRAGAGSVVARAAAGAGHEDPQGANDEASNATFVVHHRLALALHPDDAGGKQVRPEDAAAYRVTLTNLGNVPEVASLNISSAGWPAGANLTQPNASLAPGASARLLALMRSPAAGPPEARATVAANVSGSPSLGRAELSLPPTTRTPGLAAAYGFDPEVPANLTLGAGVARTFDLPVRNTGGSEDALGWSLLAAAPAGWTVRLPEPWTLLTRGAGTRSLAPLEALADASLGPGASAALQLRVASLNGGAERLVNVTLQTAAADLAAERLELDRAAVYRGDRVEGRVDARNLGPLDLERPARVLVEAVRPNGTSLVLAQDLLATLGVGQARTLRFAWDTSDVEGPFEVRARVDPGNDVPEADEGNNARTLALSVRVPGLEVLPPADRSARPGERLDYPAAATFRVRNAGSDAEAVEVVLRTAQDWVRSTRRLDLAPNETAPLPLTVQVPALPGAPVEPLLAEARLVNRSATAAQGRANISILDEAPPVLVGVAAPAFVELGTAARFEVRLQDPVGIGSAEVRLRMPDGSEQALALTEEGGAWVGEAVLAQAGSVVYWVMAADNLGNDLDGRDAQGALVVGVRSAPRIELLDPRDGATVRSGTVVRLRIADVHGLDTVEVREGTSVRTLEAPYQFSTAGWAEGPHAFEVVARNRFGNAASVRFALAVDDTPPLVQDVRADPARPAPGIAFLVEARASQDAVLASVQVLRDGRLFTDVPAQVGLGLVTASLRIEDAGRYVLAVRAEDAAGNAGSAERAVDVGSGIPGPGVVALLVALLVATRLCRKP